METAIVRHNLPAEPNAFIGRERDMPELRQLLLASRVVTLCGAGGIGKTRLALRLAAGFLPDFADGVHLVELAGVTDPDLVAARVAESVGIAAETGHDRQDTLTEALRHRRILIVLDNCEHLIEACAQLGRSLTAAAADLRILATSREPLRIPGETIWRVPPLELPETDDFAEIAVAEAVRLFARRAAESLTGFAVTPGNADSVARICRDLDGIPLAVELAAARVGMMSLRQIADRLADRFRLLTSGDRTAPARQRTLRATVEWSYDLLEPAEKVLLRRLAVFSGGWTLDMAEQVCADLTLPELEVLDRLAALVDKSLVALDREVAGELRYRLLDTVRAFALEQLALAREESEIRRRQVDLLLLLAETWYSDAIVTPRSWQRRFELVLRYSAEIDNMRAALAACLASGSAEKGLRLCVAMRVAWGYRGEFEEGLSWLGRMRALDDGPVSSLVRGRALVTYADMALEQGKVTMAREPAQAGAELCGLNADPLFTAHAIHNLGLLAAHDFRLDEAETLFLQALRTAREADDTYRESYLLATLAELYAATGRLPEALALGKEALEVTVTGLHRYSEVLIHQLLGRLAEHRGDHEGARHCFEESLRLNPELSLRTPIPALIGLGRLAAQRGDHVQAHQQLSEAMRLLRITGERLQIARALEACALLAHHQGDAERAGRVLHAAETLRVAIGCPRTAPTLDRLSPITSGARATDQEPLSVEEAIVHALLDAPEGVAPEGVAPVASTRTGPLTGREREIAVLVARGLTNRGIGEELFISPATAARHVANILNKLGFASRAQIAVYAKEQDF